MTDPVKRNIVLRHLNGSKANRLDMFEIAEGLTLRLGRRPGADVLYDSSRDDMVSRQHATITLRTVEDPTVFITDDGSSNGTFVNGMALMGERELFPDDVVELGQGGPKFVFDIQPRPESFANRTRVLNLADATATRIHSAVPPEPAEPVPEPAAAKPGVGKETVERLLFEERRSHRQSWLAIAAGLAAFIFVGGAGLYWHSARSAQELREAAALSAKQQAEDAAKAKQDALAAVSRELGTSAREVIEKYGDATVRITMQWGLYDRETGKPLFIKVVRRNNTDYLAFVQLANGDIVPWLTLDDGARQNFRVGESGSGSGFVVGSNGFILSNKHVVAGWMARFEWPTSDVLLYKEVKSPNGSIGKPALIDVRPIKWIPEREKGIVFANTVPARISDDSRILVGRNEELEVRFPGSRLGMTASLVRASTDADVGLIKVDTPQTLNPVQLAHDDQLVVGDRVTVLGYPGVSIQDKVLVTTREMGSRNTRIEIVPQPTVTEGIISRTSTAERQVNDNVTAISELGEVFQLAINTTGSGNSGGPVFNSEGRVIGFFTYGRSRGGVQVSFAVPIKYGRDLLQAQRTP